MDIVLHALQDLLLPITNASVQLEKYQSTESVLSNVNQVNWQIPMDIATTVQSMRHQRMENVNA